MKRIIIADDDLAILDAVTLILTDEGYDVVAISKVIDIDSLLQYKPDLILLDIWMSGTNGEDICRQLKKDKTAKNIPVILVSANRDTEKIAKKAHADDFLAKPFDIQDLLAIVSKHLEGK